MRIPSTPLIPPVQPIVETGDRPTHKTPQQRADDVLFAQAMSLTPKSSLLHTAAPMTVERSGHELLVSRTHTDHPDHLRRAMAKAAYKITQKL